MVKSGQCSAQQIPTADTASDGVIVRKLLTSAGSNPARAKVIIVLTYRGQTPSDSLDTMLLSYQHGLQQKLGYLN